MYINQLIVAVNNASNAEININLYFYFLILSNEILQSYIVHVL